MRIYDWIIIIIFVILFGWCVIVNNKYTVLQKDYIMLKNDKEYIIDSLNKENVRIKKTIKSLEDELDTINLSMQNQFNKIEVVEKEAFVVSNNFSKSTTLLKENLTCTDL